MSGLGGNEGEERREVNGGQTLKLILLWPVTCLTPSSTPMTEAAEVIDLTGLSSSPPAHFYSDDRTPNVDQTTERLKNPPIDKDASVPPEDAELPPTAKPKNTNPQKQRKRKKSQQGPATTKGENKESGDKRRRREDERDEPPRASSRSPGRAARRRALREKPSDSLFFVDDKPADIRAPYVSPALAGPSRTQQNDGLVLPPHVKVADGSSEAQEPSLSALSDAEEGEEDFIDYLDIDGDRSVCTPSRRALAIMYTDPENERSGFLVISMISAKLIPRPGSSVKTVARKATIKPKTAPTKLSVFPVPYPCMTEPLHENSA